MEDELKVRAVHLQEVSDRPDLSIIFVVLDLACLTNCLDKSGSKSAYQCLSSVSSKVNQVNLKPSIFLTGLYSGQQCR